MSRLSVPTNAAILLCGGQSRRMGIDKASLPFGDETLISRIARIVAPTVSQIIAVSTPGQILPPLPDDIRIITDENRGLGPLEGIRCGLAAIDFPADRALVCGCDTPLITEEAVQILFENLTEGRDAAIAIDIEQMHPTFGVYRRSVVDVAARQLSRGERSLHGFVRQLAFAPVPIARLGDERLVLNVNTPQEYEAALSAAGLPSISLNRLK
ncbi:MAG: molybdenum cofactor guanylyltransferase [Blastopirellula sp. JB062]